MQVRSSNDGHSRCGGMPRTRSVAPTEGRVERCPRGRTRSKRERERQKKLTFLKYFFTVFTNSFRYLFHSYYSYSCCYFCCPHHVCCYFCYFCHARYFCYFFCYSCYCYSTSAISVKTTTSPSVSPSPVISITFPCYSSFL